jgi:hypothetical protein
MGLQAPGSRLQAPGPGPCRALSDRRLGFGATRIGLTPTSPGVRSLEPGAWSLEPGAWSLEPIVNLASVPRGSPRRCWRAGQADGVEDERVTEGDLAEVLVAA